MKFDNFSAVDSGYSNFVITNAQNPFIYDNVLSIDILPFPSVNFLNTTYGVGLSPNRKLILQTRRLGAYSGVNEAQVIFPKLIQARHRFFQLFIADTAAHTSAYWNQTMVMYNNYLAQINSTIIPLGYRIDKSINNNLVLDKIRRTQPCGNDEILLNSEMPNYYSSKYQAMFTTPQLNVAGSCVVYRLMAQNGTPTYNIESGIGAPPKHIFNAFVQTLSNRGLSNVACGNYPRTLNQTTIQQNSLLNEWNNTLISANNALNINNQCKIQMVSGRFPLTMLPQITNT
jgi:hypothetical protein